MDKSPEEIEAGLNKILDRLKQDPLFELKKEYGTLLMKHIDDLTPTERARYNELHDILMEAEHANNK